jgi:hypothetical protein
MDLSQKKKSEANTQTQRNKAMDCVENNTVTRMRHVSTSSNMSMKSLSGVEERPIFFITTVHELPAYFKLNVLLLYSDTQQCA